jgi:predicted amidohydrolase
MAQILVEGGQPAANLARACEAIRAAADQRCRIVVLPECLDLGWTDPSARQLAQPIPGEHSQRLAAAAQASGIFVVAGLVERSGDRLYNAAVLIDPRGQLLLVHRKINELDLAHDLYAIGDRLAVAHTELGTLAVSICADNFPNSLAIGHVLARMGAQLLLSPSAWASTPTTTTRASRMASCGAARTPNWGDSTTCRSSA